MSNMIPLLVPRALIYLVEFEELREVYRTRIEAELMGEGEVPMSKLGRLSVDLTGENRLTYRIVPEGAFWNDVKLMWLRLNREGFKQVAYHGAISAEEGYMDLMVRQMNAGAARGYPVNIPKELPDLPEE